ncbi:MAG: hypothetical protein HYV46_05045 [candidate division NC10 bacterium]|nr:hypothetical protein [candidate division NC10 bacterium]
MKRITVVEHDWGSALGFHYAGRHEGNVKGLAFMEALLRQNSRGVPGLSDAGGRLEHDREQEHFRRTVAAHWRGSQTERCRIELLSTTVQESQEPDARLALAQRDSHRRQATRCRESLCEL